MVQKVFELVKFYCTVFQELSLSRTYFHGSKGIRATEVLLYCVSGNICGSFHDHVAVADVKSKYRISSVIRRIFFLPKQC